MLPSERPLPASGRFSVGPLLPASCSLPTPPTPPTEPSLLHSPSPSPLQCPDRKRGTVVAKFRPPGPRVCSRNCGMTVLGAGHPRMEGCPQEPPSPPTCPEFPSISGEPSPPQPALPNSGVPGEGASETQFLHLQNQHEGGHRACASGPLFLKAGGSPRRRPAGGSSLGGTARDDQGLSIGDGAPERDSDWSQRCCFLSSDFQMSPERDSRVS